MQVMKVWSSFLNVNIPYFSFQTVQEVLNLHPNLIKFSGSCAPDFATLKLTEDNITLTFSFSLVSFESPIISRDALIMTFHGRIRFRVCFFTSKLADFENSCRFFSSLFNPKKGRNRTQIIQFDDLF